MAKKQYKYRPAVFHFIFGYCKALSDHSMKPRKELKASDLQQLAGIKRPRPLTNYEPAIKSGQLQPVFDMLPPKPDIGPYQVRSQINKATGIPTTTVQYWQNKTKKDPTFLPNRHRSKNLALPPYLEEAIYQRLNDEYISQRKYCPLSVLQKIALTQPNLPRSFKASDHWQRKFLKRHHLSIRKYHSKRRTDAKDEIVADYVYHYELAREQFEEDFIVNIDETSWRLLNNRLVTIAKTGADEVTCEFNAGCKDCLTVIAGITRSGKRLPVWVICEGKTERCEEKFRNSPALRKYLQSKELFITRSQNGWTDTTVAKEYLKWLKEEVYEGAPIFVIWDAYRAHKTPAIRCYMENREIGHIIVPEGQTGQWQPLDFRIFGDLKARAKAMFDLQYAQSDIPYNEYQMSDTKWQNSLEILLKCWNEIDEMTVRHAWLRLDDNIWE